MKRSKMDTSEFLFRNTITWIYGSRLICSLYWRQRKRRTVNKGGSIAMYRQGKVAYEEKLRLVQKCISGELGVCEAGRIAGVEHSEVRRWIKLYESEGAEGLQAQTKRRNYSPELKQKAVLAYVSGQGSLLEICKEYRIRSTQQLESWIKVYNTHGYFNSVKQSGGGSYMKKGRITTQEERLQIARKCLESGKNYGGMALKYTPARRGSIIACQCITQLSNS